jgi:hypothetical protein
MEMLSELRAYIARNVELLDRLRGEIDAGDEGMLDILDALEENQRALTEMLTRADVDGEN